MTTLENQLLAQLGKEPRKNSTLWTALNKNGVRASAEFHRIAALPRRTLDLNNDEHAQLITEFLRKPGAENCKCARCTGKDGPLAIRPVQAAMLAEAHDNDGLFSPAAVGIGKSFIAPLFATVMKNVQRPMILVPVSLRKVYNENVLPLVGRHFRIHPSLRVQTYHELSILSGAGMLDHWEPDLIVLDEGHSAKRKESARTRRLLRYLKKHPNTRLVVMSGTITTKSLRDYAHLLEHCLPTKCAVPANWKDLQDWANALDAQVQLGQRMAPGVLLSFASERDMPEDSSIMTPEVLARELARKGFRRRLTETPGVVATSEASLGTSLIINARAPQTPEVVKQAILELRRTWRRPDGEELAEAIEFWAVARQIACGFYYRWVWPQNIVNEEWLDARADWKRAVRDVVTHNRRGIDTELAVANAVDAGDSDKGRDELSRWRRVRDSYKPVIEPVWLSDYVLQDALEWAKEAPGIIWYEHNAVGEAFERMGHIVYGAGEKASVSIEREDGMRTIVASIAAHCEGKNLQMFNRSYIAGCPASGKTWEQLTGRTHRSGQLADEVTCDFLCNTQELRASFDKAREDAKYAEQTMTVPQKLLYATITGLT